jgi:hypothetical protein
MRARDIVGKKVASVHFDRELVARPGSPPVCAFSRIVFEDGTIFFVSCRESENEGPWPTGIVIKPTMEGDPC